MMSRPSIFIGSSSEDTELANAVHAELEDVFEPTVWDQDIFAPSSYVLEEFERLKGEFDYAILILGPNDARMSRGQTTQVPRDNVIAELGLFIGALGRQRVFALTPRDGAIELPTDFLGFTTVRYGTRVDQNYRAAVRTACTKIRKAIMQEQAESQPSGAGGMVWPLGIAVVSKDDRGMRRLETQLQAYEAIVEAQFFADVDAARSVISDGKFDAMIIDIFSEGAEAGIDLIAYVRDRHREIGVALYGTFNELYELPGVSTTWRETLQHYWRIAKNARGEAFAVMVEDIVLFLFIYRLSAGKFGEEPGTIARAMMRPEVAGSWPLWRHIL